MRALFGNPTHALSSPKSYNSKDLGLVDKMCYELLVSHLISAGHSTENTINGMALFTHLKQGDVLDPGYVIFQEMLLLAGQKTGKRIPYGNVITKLIEDAKGKVDSAPVENKYYDSTYFTQRHFKWTATSWEDLRKGGEGGVPEEPEVGDGQQPTAQPFLKRTIWQRMQVYFGSLFNKVDKIQSSVDILQRDMELVKKACGITTMEVEEEDASVEKLFGDESEEEDEPMNGEATQTGEDPVNGEGDEDKETDNSSGEEEDEE